MEDSRTAAEVTITHPVTGHTLVKRYGGMKYHHPDDAPAWYRGSIVSGIYFWCQECGCAYMTTLQFGNEEFKLDAQSYDFVLAVSNTPLQLVQWIKN